MKRFFVLFWVFLVVCLELWGNNITEAWLPASLKCHRDTGWNVEKPTETD